MEANVDWYWFKPGGNLGIKLSKVLCSDCEFKHD
jgi:hypothetical protein